MFPLFCARICMHPASWQAPAAELPDPAVSFQRALSQKSQPRTALSLSCYLHQHTGTKQFVTS